MLNNSHLYHQILHDTKHRGIDVGEVKVDMPRFLKAKDEAVTGLTKGVGGLVQENKVDYYKGTGSFINEHEIQVDAIDGGENAVLKAKNIIIATGSESYSIPRNRN